MSFTETRKDLSSLNKKESDWISIKDRLPEYETKQLVNVVVTNDENTWVTSDYYDKYSKTFETNYCPRNSFRVTMWMPLPQPPKD